MKRIFSIILLLILILCLSGCKGRSISSAATDSSDNVVYLGDISKSPSPGESRSPIAQPTGYVVPITPTPGQKVISPGITISPGSSIAFDYKRIRTNSYNSGIESPKVIMIHSKKELDDYYKSVSGSFQIDSFKEAMEAYDDKWFNSNLLILVVLEENSGSIGHKVTSVSSNNNILEINITRIIPEIGTWDMAQYHILIGISLSDYNGETPKVVFNNVKQ